MSTPKRRVPPEECRRQILEATVPVLASSNFKRSRVHDIADSVGFTEAVVYQHFPTKKAIFIELLDHINGRILAFWAKQASSEEDSIATLPATGLAYYRRIVTPPDELRVQFQAISEAHDPEISLRLRKHHHRYRNFVATLIEKGSSEGPVRADVDPQTIGHLFDGAGVFVSMMKILSDRSLTEKRYERMAAQLLDSLRG